MAQMGNPEECPRTQLLSVALGSYRFTAAELIPLREALLDCTNDKLEKAEFLTDFLKPRGFGLSMPEAMLLLDAMSVKLPMEELLKSVESVARSC